MKRTIKRYSRRLNQGKWRTLVEIGEAYANQKDRFLLEYGRPFVLGRYRGHRQARDELVAAGYRSPFGLQDRYWKLALKDAIETVDRHWLALAEEVRSLVMAQRKEARFTEEQAHYAFWILKSSRRMAQLVGGQAPLPEHFAVKEDELFRAVSYLRRVIRRKRGTNPRVRKARSFALDAEMYTMFEKEGTQYIRIMTMVPYQRVIVPLTGRGEIRGNLRVVLDEERERVEIHRAIDVRRQEVKGDPVAVDLGVTEMMTDSDGDRWGEGQGEMLAACSDQVCDKGRKRSKLGAVEQRAREKGDRAKSRRIRTCNLGREKLTRQRRKMRQTIACRTNRALNAFFEQKGPARLGHENLRGLKGKFRSKRMSRLVSTWMRGIVKDRLEFKASAACCRREQVNSAYSSQMCPRCGFVHYENRQGDRFQCLFCGHGGDSDRVAAMNLLERLDDPEIRYWTPVAGVKNILLGRFQRRVEGWGFGFPPEEANLDILAEMEIRLPPTVPARTQDTCRPVPPVDVAGIAVGQSESELPLSRQDRG